LVSKGIDETKFHAMKINFLAFVASAIKKFQAKSKFKNTSIIIT